MKELNEKLEELGEYICDHVCERIKREENECETCRLEEYIKEIEKTEFKKIKCDACGFEFEPKKENHYVISEENGFGPMVRYLDCFDCPNCGCQAKTKERRGIRENQKKEYNVDENNNKGQRKRWWKK